jgi:hypothetical protein
VPLAGDAVSVGIACSEVHGGDRCLVEAAEPVGLAFHGGIALVMGLNNFFWAFSAAFPPPVFTVRLLAASPPADA